MDAFQSTANQNPRQDSPDLLFTENFPWNKLITPYEQKASNN